MKPSSIFRKALIILVLVCIGLSTKSQSIVDTTVFTFVEQMPNYPGGSQAMKNFIASTIDYPAAAIENNITGKVYVSMVVEADGSLSNIEVLKSMGYGCDKEAIRIISLMPAWNPGIHDGKNVRVSTTIPMVFKRVRKIDTPIYNNADILPVFSVSTFDFNSYLFSELRYPVGISKDIAVDTVNILYVVETDGSLSNVTLLDSTDSLNAFDYEAIRVMEKLSGKFEPAYIDFISVRVRLMVSIVFDYNDVDTLACEIKSYNYDDVDYKYYIRNDCGFLDIESMPEFPGGMANLMKFLGSNIRYPAEAKNNREQGRVFVKFLIEKDGSISNAFVIKGVSPSLDAEALRVINAMPKWIPGTIKGEPVRVTYNLPVKFTIR